MTENARKVFEILGVKPNEEFKIEGSNREYCIDSELNVYCYGIKIGVKLIIDIIKGKCTIIKLPKESKLPKKKKLRYLTEEEFLNWKRNNCGNCENCIFRNVICTCDSKYESLWVECKYLYSDAFLNKEIEVEE